MSYLSNRICRKPDTLIFWDLSLRSTLIALAFKTCGSASAWLFALLFLGSFHRPSAPVRRVGSLLSGKFLYFLCVHSVIPHPRRPSAALGATFQGQSRPGTTRPSVVIPACNRLSSEFHFLSMWRKNHLLQNQLVLVKNADSRPLPDFLTLGLSPRNLCF